MPQSRFAGKTILITGAGTGMGHAAARRLAKEGAALVLIGRRAAPIETLASEIASEGGTAFPIAGDISDQAAICTLIQEISKRFRRLDGVFANAGVLGRFGPLAQSDETTFAEVLPTNLLGTFLTVRHCLPLIERGSVLINASWTAHGVMPGLGAYAATKGALLAMMRTFAVELGPRQIRVNAINPGIILTPMADEALDPDISERLAAHTPLRRNGTPEDVVGTVAWLLSNDAEFVTGQEITVDGGYTIGGVLRG